MTATLRRRLSLPLLLASLSLGLATQPLSATVVEDWNQEMIRVFQADATAPCLGSRHLAILHAAVHDAVNLCSPRDPLYRPAGEEALAAWQAAGDPTALSAEVRAQAAEAAACGAAHEVLCGLVPARTAEFDRCLEKLTAEGSDTSRAALLAGRRIAAQLLAERADDGSSTTVHYVPKEGAGQWRRTEPSFRPPEGPHWGLVRPFCLKQPSQFRAPEVPVPESAEFARILDESRRFGGKESSERSAEQTMIARFWSDFSYTSTPPGHWNQILREIALKEHLELHDSARVFYLLNLAMADAGIAVWDSKYYYNTWRPVTAIQETADKNWHPLLVTPPHPDYLSGHSGFSGAAAAVLEAALPPRPAGWSFLVSSDTVKDVTRSFTSFADCAKEVSESRIFGGIHFRHACEEGVALGRKIGAEVIARYGSDPTKPTE